MNDREPAPRQREPHPRRAICLDCRTLHRHGAPCAYSRRHTVVALDTEQGRSALRREVWETPWVPRAALASQEWRVASLITPAVVGILCMNAWAAAGTALVMWGARAGDALRARSRRMAAALTPPRGRPGHLRLLGRRDTHLRGHLRGPRVTAPLTGRPCLGYSVLLRANEFFGGDIMLIDAWIGDGSVALHDGRTVHIPEGLVEIDDPAPDTVTDQAAIERFLAGLAPGETRALLAGERPPVPYDVVTESILPVDTELEVAGKLVEVPGMYRDAGRAWRLRDVPILRVVEPPPAHAEP
jgi:hypothetical protein